jgi:hypothetical protein
MGAIRLPRHRGLFYFGPNYLRSEEEWKSSFSELIESLLRHVKHPWSIIDHSAWTITIRFELTDFNIDAKNGTFMLDEHNDDDEWGMNEWIGPINSPSAFFEDLSNSQPPEHLQVEVNHVLTFVSELTDRMRSRYHVALKKGQAVIEARIGSISNDFRLIDMDQMRHLRVLPFDHEFVVGREDSTLDDAVGPNGEKFYSLCIVPTVLPTLPTKSEKPPLSDARRRYEWEKIDAVIQSILTRPRLWAARKWRSSDARPKSLETAPRRKQLYKTESD